MATMGTFSFTATLFSFLLVSSIARANDQSYLAKGSSISTQDDTTTILVSPNGAFSCGSYKVATNTFTFSIWFSRSSNNTIAWTANRDALVNGKGSKLTFWKNGGKGSKLTFWKNGGLDLIDCNGTTAWSTNTTATRADQIMLLNSGNLLVMDSQGHHLWRSFDSPTDTLLPSQPMTRNTKLVSAISKGLLYSCSYTFYINSDNMLTLIYNGPEISSIYWPDPFYKSWEIGRTTYNGSQYGVLDQKGHFVASDQLEFEASDLSTMVMRRLNYVCYMIISSQFCRFSYKELHKATKCFQEKLGSGGSGVVYKGVLNDERKVAVKRLNDVIQGEQEFRSELSVIGRIYHMNLTRIWGFCAEKKHRILVSEFVENGSLDRVLFDNQRSSPLLQWGQRCNIASEDQSWLLEFVDNRLDGKFNYSQAAMMANIALSCVEEERRRRPSMAHVVETLLSLVE